MNNQDKHIVVTQEMGTFSAIQKAELDTQITTAKAFRRDVALSCSEAIAMVKMSEEIAKSCMYALPRKDYTTGETKFITGPSVRLAEIVSNCWGNLHAGTRIVENDGKKITAEAVAWDLEKNNKIVVQVSRGILTKTGKTYTEDMQTVTGNAAAAIAYRNAVFKVLPRSIVDRVLEEARHFAIGAGELISKRFEKAVNVFQKMGINESQLLKILNVSDRSKVEEGDLEILIGLVNAIKEGSITIDTIFNDTDKTNEKGDSAASVILADIKKKKEESKKKAESSQEQDEFVESLGEVA